MAFDQVSNERPHKDNKQDLVKLSEEPFRDCKLWNRKEYELERHRYDDRKTFLQDMLIHSDSPYAKFGGPMHERTTLENTIRHKMPVAVASVMQRDMETFEKRARHERMPPELVQKVYHDINRMFTDQPTRELLPAQKQQLAREILHQAAHPESIVQGHHNTCNVASVEFRLYARNPDKAAQAVVNMAMHGKFQTQDGTWIKLDKGSLVPDSEAKNNPEDGTRRTYASQLLQIGAVNTHWQRRTEIDGIRYSYEQDKQGNERVMEYIDGKPHRMTDRDGSLADSPMLTTNKLTDIYNQIAGTNDAKIAAENANGMRQKNVRLSESTDADIRLESPKQLHDLLSEAKRNHRLPVFIGVHTGNHPFDIQELRENPTLARVNGNFGWHAVAIYDYHEASHTAKLHNSWGKKNDLNVRVDTLYKATIVPDEPGFRGDGY
jgi:hypothetical protein